MKGIILAVGEGKKMWPYSDHWQKAAMPVGNVPNVLRLVNAFNDLGISDVKVVVGYKDRQVRYALRDKEVQFIDGNSGGTASDLGISLDGESLVAYGDISISPADLAALLERYRAVRCPAVLFKELSRGERSIDWICCNTDGEEVKAIYGHPREHYVNGRVCGVFVLNDDVKPYLRQNPGHMKSINVGGMPIDEAMLEQSLQMMLEDGKILVGVKAKFPVVDIDKPWLLIEANEATIRREVAGLDKDYIDTAATIHPSAIIEGKLAIGKGSYIGKNVIIKGNVVIGENTIIDYGSIVEGNVVIGNNTSVTDYCRILPFSTVGDKNRMGYNAEFQGITFEGVSMTHCSQFCGIVGEYTDIAAGCVTGVLRFDDSFSKPKVMGRKELGNKYTNGAFIGDYCRTGVANVFIPGVMVGKNSALGPGAVITENIPAKTLLMVEQQLNYTTWGPERYGW